MEKTNAALLSLIAILIICLSAPNSAHAQFEGTVIYNSYEVTDGDKKQNRDQFTMYVTPDRILLQGENKYDFIGNIKTEGVLIRLDVEDFVFLTGDTQALKISKSDITSMFNMFGNGNEDKDVDLEADVSYEKTGETKTINGYHCEKFIFREQEEKQRYAHVWMTRDLKIDWGMLSEPWSTSAEAMISKSFPMNLIFKDGYLPLKMESYEGNDLRMVTEVQELSKGPVAKNKVDVPQGVRLLSFQDYLFQKLSEN